MTDDEIYYGSFPHILHKVTANLRYIFLEIIRQKRQITVVGWYGDEISDKEEELLVDISDGIASMIDEDFLVTASFTVSQEKFELDNRDTNLLYARYENFS